MAIWQQHPFAVKAHFERVIALSYALPAEFLHPMLPAGLTLDEYQGYGFLTVAMVWTRQMRPAFLPPMLGRSFFLSGYRIFTRLTSEQNRTLRGLFILGSETDRASMVTLGNLMTGYHYRKISLTETHDAGGIRVLTHNPQQEWRLDLHLQDDEHAALPAESPFPDWRTARQFAGPMPFTFTPAGHRSFMVIEGARTSWTPRPLLVYRAKVAMLEEEPFCEAQPRLANAFTVSSVDYTWKKGIIMKAQR